MTANLIAFAAPLLLVVLGVCIGVPEVRELRRKTGDTSLVTYILGFEFLRRK